LTACPQAGDAVISAQVDRREALMPISSHVFLHLWFWQDMYSLDQWDAFLGVYETLKQVVTVVVDGLASLSGSTELVASCGSRVAQDAVSVRSGGEHARCL